MTGFGQKIHKQLSDRTVGRIASYAKHSPYDEVFLSFIPVVPLLELSYASELDSDIYSRRSFNRILRELIDLRVLMYDDVVGTWLSLSLTIRKDFSFTMEFNYEDEPFSLFGDSFDVELFVKDVRAFPRDDKYIPDWLFL